MESGKSLSPSAQRALLSSKLSAEFIQPYDLVMVFKNPFELKNYSAEFLDVELSKEEASKAFERCFRVSLESEEYSEINEKLNQVLNSSPTKKKIAQLQLETILVTLQHRLQMDVVAHVSRDLDEVFMKLRTSEENFQVQADLIDYELQLKEDPEDILPFQEVAPYAPFEKKIEKPVFSYLELSQDVPYKRYDQYGHEKEKGTLFRNIDRIRLMKSMLSSVFDVGELYFQGILLSMFPLHQNKPKVELKSTWGNFYSLFKNQNIQEVRLYFGEKISMYFAWLNFYVKWLYIPSVIGFLLGIIIYATNDLNDSSGDMSAGEVCTFLFAVFISVNSTLLDQLWLRNQNTLAWKWGFYSEEYEEQRPHFKGVYQKDPITGKMKKVVSDLRKVRVRRILGYGIIVVFVWVVIACVVALFLYRASLSGDWGIRIVGILTALQIKVLNFIYRYVARKMTDWENFETDSEYNNSLTIKLFCFQFVNSYSSLFYIAFFKGNNEGCTYDDCMYELAMQLGTIFITNVFLNAIEIGTPFVFWKLRMRKENKRMHELGITQAMTVEERENKLDVYDTPLDDYMEVVITYGYIVLFGVAFPFSPLFGLVLGVIELKVDAWKLCSIYKRPFPLRAKSIGVWNYIIQALSYIGCGTTIAIILFTTDVFDFSSTGKRWVCFLVLEHLLFAAKLLISAAIPDCPSKVTQGLNWSKRIANEKVYGRLSDVDKERSMRQLEFVPLEERHLTSMSEVINEQ